MRGYSSVVHDDIVDRLFFFLSRRTGASARRDLTDEEEEKKKVSWAVQLQGWLGKKNREKGYGKVNTTMPP